jgi:PQQ-dependent catabolism-associated CXXCW motif protein
MDDYRAPTPTTVASGVVLETDVAHELWRSGNAVWIDVLPAPRRPPNLPAPTLWVPLPRYDIGQPRLPDVGRGALSPELESYFRDHLEVATNKSRRNTPVVFYCFADCWMG